MGNIGNTFDKKEFSVGHARKVWREIRNQYPGGGNVTNIANWTKKGVIPSGRPCTFNPKTKTVQVYTTEEVLAAASDDDDFTLNINGYIQEDVVVTDAQTVASATVVYDGEIYEYMFSEEEAAILKANTATPMIVWVQ